MLTHINIGQYMSIHIKSDQHISIVVNTYQYKSIVADIYLLWSIYIDCARYISIVVDTCRLWSIHITVTEQLRFIMSYFKRILHYSATIVRQNRHGWTIPFLLSDDHYAITIIHSVADGDPRSEKKFRLFFPVSFNWTKDLQAHFTFLVTCPHKRQMFSQTGCGH